MRRPPLVSLFAPLIAVLGCVSSGPVPQVSGETVPGSAAEETRSTPTAVPTPPMSGPPVLVGTFGREALVSALPAWGAAVGEAHPDPEAAAALLAVEPGPEVLVLLGTWCGDSRRELARLWSAFDLAGGEPRFAIRYVAVDRARQEPAAETAGRDLRFVPTFIVEREGREVGRIVEVSPNGVERDLLDLLTGARTGVLSARTDLGP